MNQSDLKAMRARLQSRQAQDTEAHAIRDAAIGAAGFAILFIILAFI
jgi:hypothetical protein